MKPFKFSRKKREYIKWGKNLKEVRIFTETPRGAETAAPLQVDETAAKEVYANLAAVSHTETEFVLDFIFLPPNQPKGRVSSRIISGHIHTKRLCAALRKSLKQYEARFGTIPA